MRSLLFGRLTPLSCAFFGDVTPYSRVIDPDFGVGCHIFYEGCHFFLSMWMGLMDTEKARSIRIFYTPPWLRGSIPAPAPAPAPSKTFRRLRLQLRLRAKCTGSGGSDSGSGSDAQVLIWALTSNTIFKNVKYQNMTSYWLDLEFECYFEWVPLKFVAHCHPRSVSDTGEVTNSLELRCLSGLLLSS